ncbi:MAG: hypothetical protein Q4A32_04675, partial [Lachnospiraceae bacterium]|nr:hypothetical protein [Lachnospiraceae bacterium]
IYHLYDYQFFFRNLEENVNVRLSAFNEKYKERLDVFYNDEIVIFDVEEAVSGIEFRYFRENRVGHDADVHSGLDFGIIFPCI